MSEFLQITIDKFIFRVAKECLYTPEGLWVKKEGDQVLIGLSDFLQQRSGDVAFADVKSLDTEVSVGNEIATIETIKIDISLNSPLTGKIVEVNTQIDSAPEVINQDPYGEGWLCKLVPTQWQKESAELINAETYLSRVKQEAEEELKQQ